MDDMDGSEDDGDDDNGVADDDDDDEGRASQRGLLGLKMTVQHGRSRPQAGSGAELNAIGLPESAQWRTHQDGASYSRQATRILKSTPARPQGHMFVHCKLKQCHPLKLSKSIISVNVSVPQQNCVRKYCSKQNCEQDGAPPILRNSGCPSYTNTSHMEMVMRMMRQLALAINRKNGVY